MPTRETDSQPRGLGGLGKKVAEHARSFVRLELELAALELKKKVSSIAVGIGLGVGAAIVSVFALGFLFATAAAALATFLSTWLALLVVTLGLFGLTAILGLLAMIKIKKGTPPVPEQAIREAKLTTEALKNNGR
jgi:4-amino-4-deoxy-L-arabinose transferase-like glycosyltransferase